MGFWVCKVLRMTTKTIKVHWYDTHDTKKDQYYEKGNRHRPQTHTYVHKELTIIHWGLILLVKEESKKLTCKQFRFSLMIRVFLTMEEERDET